MAQCVEIIDGNVVATDSGACSYVLVSMQELNDLQATNATNLIQIMNDYFAFDAALFGQMLTTCLVTFITGLTAGFIYKKLSR